jgi:hypothetical protein
MVEMDGVKNSKTAGLLLPPSTTTTSDTAEREDDDYDNID